MNGMLIKKTQPNRMAVVLHGTPASATTLPMLRIAGNLALVRGETHDQQVTRLTVTISKNGGTGSKLLITLARTTTTPSGTSTTDSTALNGATYTTAKLMVDAINATTGFKAEVLNCLHETSMDAATFKDLATTHVPNDGRWLNCLYSSGAVGSSTFMRIALPEGLFNSHMGLVRIEAISSHAAGTLSLYRDSYAEGKETLLRFVPSATRTVHVDRDMLNAPIYQGPLVVAFEDVTSQTSGEVIVTVFNAEL